jgi:DNA repair photolyase
MRVGQVRMTGSGPEWVELHRTSGDASYIGIVPQQVLNPPASTGMAFWSINPYVGCEFGCAYCYARETHRWTVERSANRRGASRVARDAARLPAAQAFERRILVKLGADTILARTLDPARIGHASVMIGSATDPYQPAERRFAMTRKILEVFLRHEGMRIGIITKSALVERDVPLLAELSRRHRITVHFSIASVDRQLLRRLEPRSAAPHARLRAMARLREAGVRADALIMPVLPGLTDGEDELRAVMHAVRSAGGLGVAGGALRMGPATRHTLLPWLEAHRPALAARYRAHYAEQQHPSAAYQAALRERLERLERECGFGERDLPWMPLQGELFPEQRGDARPDMRLTTTRAG